MKELYRFKLLWKREKEKIFKGAHRSVIFFLIADRHYRGFNYLAKVVYRTKYHCAKSRDLISILSFLIAAAETPSNRYYRMAHKKIASHFVSVSTGVFSVTKE